MDSKERFSRVIAAVTLLMQEPDWQQNKDKETQIRGLLSFIPSVPETVEIAKMLHGNQTDFGGQPYIGHLLGVHANLLREFPDADEEEEKGSLLHDSIEDVVLFKETLSERRFNRKDLEVLRTPDNSIIFVEEVTREANEWQKVEHLPLDQARDRFDEMYQEKIEDLCRNGRRGSKRIKLSDNLHNLDPERETHIKAKNLPKLARLRVKYTRSVETIRSSLMADSFKLN